jgi:hypothetical protein
MGPISRRSLAFDHDLEKKAPRLVLCEWKQDD